jgi:ABC-type multidrug transport system fused ATPase/permease subunit
VNPDRNVEALSKNVSASFKRRVECGDKYPLFWALHETFKREFYLGGFSQLLSSILQVIAPFALRYLIQFAMDAYFAKQLGRPEPNIGGGLGIVIGITFMILIQSLGTNQFLYCGMMVGGQMRAVLISAIFEKSMTISGRAKAGGRAIEGGQASGPGLSQKKADMGQGIAGDGAGWGNGRIMNLMSVDTHRLDQASGMFHLIWTAPISCVIALVLLIINLDYCALAGFGLLVIGVPLLTRAMKSLFVRRKAINKITDQRVSLTQEILQAVKFVKYFGWEKSFLSRLGDIRDCEIRAIQILLAIRNAINAMSMASPLLKNLFKC